MRGPGVWYERPRGLSSMRGPGVWYERPHVVTSNLCTLLRSWSRLDSLLRTLFGDSDGGGQAQSSRPTQPDCTAHHFTLHYLSVWIAGADRTSSNGARQYPAGHQPSNPYPIGPFQANTLHRQFFEESHHTIVLSVSEALIPTDQPSTSRHLNM